MALFIDPNQRQFRARNDDGTETTATWIAAVDTNWSQNTVTNFRVRITTQADVGAGANSPIAPTLYYSLNGGTSTQVTSSSNVVRLSPSSQFADGAATTQQLSGGLGLTYVAGSMQESSSGAVSRVMAAGLDISEDEWCVQIQAADVANGDTITLQQKTGTAGVYATYTVTPSITVIKLSSSGLFFSLY